MQILIPHMWDSAFLAGSQVMPVQLVHRPHF
jgi:hypothetical protein